MVKNYLKVGNNKLLDVSVHFLTSGLKNTYNKSDLFIIGLIIEKTK